jgi:hypothetical protein
MMSRQELTISTEIIESIKSKTVFTVPSRSIEIVNGILEYFATLKIELSKESLLSGDYLKLNSDEKDKLLVYFYWMHNRNKKTIEEDFVSCKIMHQYLNVTSSYENRFLRQYLFQHSIQCPCCGSVVDVNFKNLKIIEVSETECSVCNHVIGDVIYAKCRCEHCRQIISEAESYVNSLSKVIEKAVQARYYGLDKYEDRELSEQKLKWFADKYSSDLSKDERESISYMPNSVNELQEMLGKRAPGIISKLKEKNAVYEKLVLRNINEVIFNIKDNLKCTLSGKSPSVSFSGYIDFNAINLSNAKVNYLKTFYEGWGSSKKIHVEIVFDNNSFEFIPDMADPKRREWFKDLDKAHIEFFSTVLPTAFSLNEDKLFKKTEALNPFFFNTETIEDYPSYNESDIIPLFKSKVECNKYHFLINKYINCIIMANVRLADLIVIKSIESFYDSVELRYLRNCIIDFVFYSEDGLPLKVIELQRGEHHNDNEYIIRDRLKKSAIKRIGILYEETF